MTTACYTPEQLEEEARSLYECYVRYPISNSTGEDWAWEGLDDGLRSYWREQARIRLCQQAWRSNSSGYWWAKKE